MILKRFSVFYILLFLCLGAANLRAQASLQRGVRISNANGNIVSLQTGATTLTYSLTLPLSSNPSLTSASLLYGTGTGNLGWTDATGASSGWLLSLQLSGGNLIPTWIDPLSLNYWSLNGNPTTTAWNGLTGNFIGTTSTQPLVIATTNTTTAQPIEFYTNNVERMRLSETGKLGVGQTNPSQLLEVGSGGNILLSNSGTAGQLQFQGTGSGLTTLQAGAQGATNINYTWPLAAPAVGGYVLAASTAGVMSWIDPSSLSTTDWHLLGNFGTTAWNGATGNFLGTTDAQPTVIATTSTATPQPIEFFTNTTEKVRISATGNVGINQTNPSQLLEVKSGNILLSNAGTADQLQFQGTSSGITTLQAGAQGATNINYTLPTAAAAANGYVLSATTGGTMSWIDPTTLPTNDWHILGNSGTTAWNGATGNFVGTTDVQPLVVATTNTTTPQPIEFYTNNAEKMRLSSTGKLGLNQTNPSQLLEVSNGNFLLSNTGSADQLQFQGTSSGITTFQAGAQGAANINYTLPTAAAAANGYVLSATTGGAMSWIDPTTIPTNDWHILGNAGTTAWNGATGNFVGTTDLQPTVIATTNTATPQPIEFFTNTTEKVRISAAGNLGINQTNPSQLLELKNGNFLLSNTGSADQLQFQGTGTGISTFQGGAQGVTNLNYTLPIAAPSANSLLYSSGGAASNLSWSNAGSNGQILTITGGILSWVNASALPGFVFYDITSAQNASITRTDNLFNVAYGAGGNDANAAGAVITSVGGATNRTATGLTVTSTATGTGTSTGLSVTASGGASQTALAATGNINLLSAAGTASSLSLQNPAATFATTFTSGAQGTNINYTLPTAAAAVNNYVLASTTTGTLSWIDATTVTNDWHLIGNATATAWNGAAGSFLGTTSTQPLVVATTNTTTPQPIEFYTNTTEKMRLSAAGNLGINQTNPTQLLEVRNGNFFLSNSGAADQLQFQGTSTGISTFQGGAQGVTNLNYTLPIAAPSANSLLYSSGGAVNNLNWSNTGSNGQILTITGGVPSWQNSSTLTGFVLYDVTTPQNASVTRTDNLFNVAYGAGGNDANAAGAVITSVGGATNRTATGLTVTSTATGTGTSTGLSVTASGGASQTALAATGNINLLSSGGTASSLSLQNPAGTFASSFVSGAQAANLSYTLPVSAPSANSLLYSSGGAVNNLNWSNTGSNGQILTITGGVPSWQNSSTLTGFVLYDVTTPQNASVTRTDNLFNVAYGAGGNDANAAGAVITSVGGATNRTATGLTVTSTATGTGTSTGLSVTASGGASQTALAATGNINLLSAAGTASSLSLQNPAATFATTFTSGAQGTNINYTLPTAAAAVNNYVLASTTTGTLSWIDATTVTNDWHLIGNATATAWNGAAGSFLGTTSTQPLVVATTNTTTPQPIEFYTNTTEKMRLSAAGNLGINQTNPTQLLEVRNGNFFLSNSGAADQLQFQGTSTGISTFQGGAQGVTNLNYTLPIAAPSANSLLYSSGGAVNNLNWSNTGSNGQILTITGGVPSWQNSSTLTGFVLYDVTTPQNASVTRTDNLFNVAYGAGGNDANAAGAVITSVGGATNRTATGLTVTSTATGTGTSTGLSVTASGGASQTALAATGNINLLSSGGTASSLSLQNPAGTFASSFVSGAQAANLSYTLPVSAPSANSLLYSSGGAVNNLNWSNTGSNGQILTITGGVPSWQNSSTLTGFVLYDVTTPQNPAVTRTDNLFNVAYAAGANDANAAGAVITAAGGATNRSATGLSVSSTATGTGTSTGLSVTASGGASQTALAATGNINLLSAAGTASSLSLQNPAGTFASSFVSGAQAANLSYTLPVSAPSANSLLYSSGGAVNNLNWSNTGSNGQILTITGGVPSWQNTNTLTGFVLYDVTTPQNASVTRTDNLFNVAYGAGGNDANAAGAVITSVGGATNRTATGLTVTSTATGTGTSTGLSVTASGGASQTALAATGNINLLSAAGTASSLSLQNPAATFATTFTSGAQGTNINYTLPTAAAAVNNYVLASTTTGTLSWIDATTVTNDWHLIGNATATAWNGAAGSFLGTTSTQPLVVATTNTTTPQPIEFYTNTTEKMRLSAAGNLGINQTNPTQLLEVRNGNFFLSNSGAADQLQFQGTSTGISTFQGGAQGVTNLNYTLPIAAPSANSLLYSSGGAVNNLNWSNTGSNGQILTITGGVPSWQNSSTLTGFVLYDVTTPQNPAVTRTDNLFNVAYAAGANDANAAGAVITAAGGATNRSATGLSVSSTATGTGASTALTATASGGASQTALAATGNVNLLSAAGTASSLSLQNPAGTFSSSFVSGAQAANLSYTLPVSAPSANSLLYSSGGAVNNLNWSNTGSNGQILTITGGVPSWQNSSTLTGFVLYDVTTPQNPAVTRTDNLFNVAYAAGANDANAAGAVITAAGGATNRSATGLSVSSTATGTGASTALAATASGGASQTALAATGNINLLSAAGTASSLSLQNPAGTFATTFTSGAQGANINYTLPTAAAAVNNYVLASTTTGTLSWIDATTVTNDWHLIGNATATAWNGAAGSFLGTTSTQPLVVATTNTTTPQPIEFYTNTTEKMRLSAAGNLGINQTNPTQLLEVRNGNFFLSNSGAADQLQFQGTSTGISTFQGGAQGVTNLNYTLPIAAPSANSLLYSSGGAVNNLNWSNTGSNGQILTITGGVPSWQNTNTLTGFVLYDVTTPQNASVTRTDNLFNVAYGAGGNDANAAGAVITSVGGATNRTATGLTVTSTATGTGASTGLSVTASGGASQTALAATGNINLLSAAGTASSLSLQNPAGTFSSSFVSGAQAANLSYTLPVSAPSANSLLYSSGGAVNNLNWSNTGSNGQILTITGGVPSWQNTNTLTGFVLYDVTTPQNASVTRTDNLFNVAYGAGGNDANAAGAVITSVGGATNRTATGLTVTSTATGTGASTGLSVTASGGASQTALAATGNINLLSAAGTASSLSLQNPAGTFSSSFVSGAQAANLSYTLPVSAPSANSLLYSSGGAVNNLNWSNTGSNGQILTITGGVPSWQNSSTLTGFVLYDVTTPQNPAVTRTDNLFNVAYAAGANDANAAGAVITAAGGATNRSATGLSVSSTATGTGASTALTATASGGASQTALAATGNVNLLSAAGTASSLSLQNPAGTFSSSFVSGAQAANLSYTLPVSAPSANSLLYSSGGAVNNLNWSNTGSNGQILTITGGVPSWQNSSTLTGFVLYDVTTPQNPAVTRTDNLFNVAYAAGANDANAAGAVITAAGGATNRSATGLSVSSTATGTGASTALAATASGGASQTALAATGNINLLSAAGTASSLSLQNPAGTFATTFTSGAQGANINYTLPTAAAAVNNYVLASTTTGTLSWIDATTVTNDWHLIGNATATAWNGAAGSFLGTTSTQPLVVATTNTTTPQPIEFYTNTTEKMRLSAAGNLGINQTNPSQLLEVKNGNFLLSNSATADQLQFQGTSTGLSTFQGGAQGVTNLNYTLPIAAPSANSLLYSSGGAVNNLNWSNTGSNGQILTITGGVPSWQNTNTLTGFVLYDVTTPQNASVTRTDNLFNVAYGAGGNDANAAGAVITSVGGATNRTATGLTVTSTATGTGASTGLSVTASGGASQTALAATGNINLLSAAGTASSLSLQNPAGTFSSSFVSGAQAANLSYTLPVSAPSANSLLYSSGGAVNNLNWSNTGSNGQILTITGGVPSWQNSSTLTGFVLYDVTTPQNPAVTRTDNLFNVAYAAGANDANAAGAVITAAGGATNRSATGLSVSSTATGTGASTALAATASGGASQTALAATGNINLLSAAGTASSLSLQNPAGTFSSSFVSGAQAANLSYTLPTAAPVASSILYSSGGVSSNLAWTNTGSNGQVLTISGGVPSWQNSAAGGSFVNYNTASVQNTAVITSPNYLYDVAYAASATTNNALGAVITSASGTVGATNATGLAVTATANSTGTSTALNVTAGGGTTNYAALFNGGNVGIGQATPSQLLEVHNGNFLLSNSATADQLQFQGTSTGLSTFAAGAQGANTFNYTLPIAVPTANQVLTATAITGAGPYAVTLGWQTASAAGSFVNYNTASVQNTAVITSPNYLFDVAYAASATTNNALGGVISSVGGTTGVTNATGLAITATAHSTGTSTGLNVTAGGGSTNYAALFNGGNVGIGQATPTQLLEVRNGNLLLSNSGTADQLQFQGTSTGTTSFLAGAQGATNLSYTLPTAAPVASSLLYSSGGVASNLSWSNTGSNGQILTITGGVPSWQNAATLNGTFVLYDVTTPQNVSVTRTDNLFNVAYGAGANDANANGAVITSAGGATNRNGTGLTIAATATGTGTSTGLTIAATGGTNNYAATFTNGRVAVGNAAPNTSLDVSNDLSTREYNYGTSLNGSYNDVSFDGLAPANEMSFVRIASATGPFTFTGVSGGQNGKFLTIYNGSTQSMTIANQNAGSIAANRIITGTQVNIPVPSGGSADLIYSATENRWVVHATSGVSGWLYTGNSGLTDGVNNFHGTLDNTPIRFVAGATNAPSTKMVLDINGNLLFGKNSGVASFTQGSGRLAFGDSLSTTRLASVPTYINRVFNMIDPNAVVRVWRFNSNAGGTDPAVELIGGTNDNQGNAANHWWDVMATGTPGVAGSGTGGYGEHMTFRRRTGASDSEYLSIFAGGNIGIGNDNVTGVPTPDTRLVVRQYDGATNTISNLTSLLHSTSNTSGPTAGFGTGLVFKSDDSLGSATPIPSKINQEMARIAGVWTNAVDGSQTGALTFSTVNNAAADAEHMRILGNGNVGIGTTTPNVVMDINGGLATEASNITLSNGTNNNMALGNESFAKISGPSAAFTITGIANGTDGKILRILNTTSQNMTISNNNASSTAGNRIITGTGADITLKGTNTSAMLVYDLVNTQWVVSNTNSNQFSGPIGSIVYVTKPSTQTITNSTALTNDNDLSFSVNPNETWEIHAVLDATVTAAGSNIQIAFAVPAGATLKTYYTAFEDAVGAASTSAGASVLNASGVGKQVNIVSGTDTYIHIDGIVRNGANAGTVQLKWAQKVGGGSTSLLQDSYLKATRVN